MSKTSFDAAAKAAMAKDAAKAAKQAILNAQKVDASIITDECGKIAIRKSPWNDAEIISDNPKVIPGRMVCSGGDFGDQLDFKPYAQTGEKKYTEIIHTSHGALRTSPQRAYCEASGIPYDKSCITPERMIFITDCVLEKRGTPSGIAFLRIK